MSSLLLSPFSRIVSSFDYSTVSGKLLLASLCAAGLWLTSPPHAHARRVGIWPRVRKQPQSPPYDPLSSDFAREQSRLFANIDAEREKGRSNRLGHLRGALKASGSFERWRGRCKAKAVVFAGEKRKEVLVENWIIPELHQFNMKISRSRDYHTLEEEEAEISQSPEKMIGNGHVQWCYMRTKIFRYNELPREPDWFNLISCPRTSYPRDVADSEAEDDEGDLVMSDADDAPPSTSMESLVDCFALLSLG